MKRFCDFFLEIELHLDPTLIGVNIWPRKQFIHAWQESKPPNNTINLKTGEGICCFKAVIIEIDTESD